MDILQRHNRLRRIPLLGWLVAGAIDQVLGLYERLPLSWRHRIEGAILTKFVGGVATLIALIWGIISSIPPWWLFLGSLGTLWLSLSVVNLLLGWAKLLKLGGASPMAARPVPGEGFDLLMARKTCAHLAVSSSRTVKRCAALLTSVQLIDRGQLWSTQTIINGNIMRQPRYLRWSSREHAATGDYNQWLDIPGDGTERWLDVAVVDRSDLQRFGFVTADDKDRPWYACGWFKITIQLRSDSGPPEKGRDCVFLLGLHYRGERVPAPLELYDWHPRGEQLLAAQSAT